MKWHRLHPGLWMAEPLPGLIWMIRTTRAGYLVSHGRQWRQKAPRYDFLHQAKAAAEAALNAALEDLKQARAA